MKEVITQSTAPQEIHASRQLAVVQHDVNKSLNIFFATQVSRARPIGASYVALWQAMADLALAGGKRLRPYVAIVAYEAFGGTRYKQALQVAVGLELLHFSLLIHDDIIDRDDMRYGRENLVAVFRQKYNAHTKSTADATHYAQAAALLAGDLLIAAAHQRIAGAPFDDHKKQTILSALDTGMFDVVGGQLLDTEAVLLPLGHSDSLAIAHYKTASYSFVLPLVVGALLSDVPDATIAKLRLIGQNVGIAYQLRDDLLDIFGDQRTLGKPLFSDVQEGKPTYVLQLALRMASPAQHDELVDAVGNTEITKNTILRIRHIVASCGAKDATETAVQQYKNQALSILSGLHLQGQARAALQDFIQKALQHSTKA